MKTISREDALAQGLLFYFTNLPCANGHITKRYTSHGKCHGCSLVEMAKKREATSQRKLTAELGPRAQAKKEGRTRYWLGTPCVRAGHIAERHTASAVCVECARENRMKYAQHPDHLEKARQHRRDDPERYRTYTRNRRAKSRGTEGKHSKDDIKELLKAQKGRCAYCKEKITKWHVDHRKALSRGGTNDRRNLQLLCGRCNRRKHAKDEISFARELGQLI